MKLLREGQPRATYASSERLVSVPSGTASSERLEVAEAVLDALAGAAALAA